MATKTFYLTEYDALSSNVASISNENNPVGKGVSNTTYAQIDLRTGSNASTSAYYLFDTSSIPDGSTINSVSCKVKVLISTTTNSYISTRTVQLYSGLTPLGAASSVSTSTSTITLNFSDYDITLAQLRYASIRLVGVRGTSQKNAQMYFRLYGAELTVDYTAPMQTLTINNKAGVQMTPSQTAQYERGTIVPVTINADNLPVVKLDGENITSQFVPTTSQGGTYTADIVMNTDHILMVRDFSTGLYIKVDGTWKGISKVYLKENGSWMEQSGNPFESIPSDTNTGYFIDKE